MPSNQIDLLFADGEYTFALPGPRINELQEKTGIGIGGLLNRLAKGIFTNPVNGEVFLDAAQSAFYFADIVETIRQGLLGGGQGIVDGAEVKVTDIVAKRLIDNYVLTRPLSDHWSMAASIIGACINGYDPPKKDLPADQAAGALPRKRAAKKKAGSTTASS